MNLYTEVEFDVEAAVEAASNNVPQKEKEKWEKYQKEEREKLKNLDHNAIHGYNQIEIATNALTFVTDPEQIEFELTRLAEGYALIGDFQKAVETTRDEVKRGEYQAIIDAFDAPDCPCPLTTTINTEKGSYKTPNRRPKLQFRDKTLYQCSNCLHLRVCSAH